MLRPQDGPLRPLQRPFLSAALRSSFLPALLLVDKLTGFGFVKMIRLGR